MSFFKTPKGTELPILDMRGKPYLQVAHRIVWFREEKPNWRIETNLIVFEPGVTVAKATIFNEQNQIMATAHKREDTKGFFDHLEKAETGAIGRALALVGYGTQFCADELDEGKRLADSPMPPARTSPKPEAPKQYPKDALVPPVKPAPKAAVPKAEQAPKIQSAFEAFANPNAQMTENDLPF
jgi:hypothetical protein